MDIRAILAGLAFALIWSSAFTSARIILADAPPILSLSLRFLISGLIGIALARFLGQTWRLTPGQWRATVVFGLCQNALYLGLNFVAMQTVEASLASIIASTMPLAVGLAGWVIFRERLSALGVLGLCAGAGGVVLIMGARMQAGADFYGIALCFIAVASLTVATLMVRGASSGGNLLMIVGLQMLVGAGFLVIPGLVRPTCGHMVCETGARLFLYGLDARSCGHFYLVLAGSAYWSGQGGNLPLFKSIFWRDDCSGVVGRDPERLGYCWGGYHYGWHFVCANGPANIAITAR